jgi:hypothetical protein
VLSIDAPASEPVRDREPSQLDRVGFEAHI